MFGYCRCFFAGGFSLEDEADRGKTHQHQPPGIERLCLNGSNDTRLVHRRLPTGEAAEVGRDPKGFNGQRKY